MHTHLRESLLPCLAVVAATLGLFSITYGLDHASYAPSQPYVASLLSGDANSLRFTLTAIAQSLAATLGLMTAIVLVIVQLSANRYTPKITDSFTHNLTNLFVFSLFIISIIFSLWVAQTVREDFQPRHAVLVALILMTACYALVIPYFLFVFRILNPRYIVNQLRESAVTAVRRAHNSQAAQKETRKIVVRKLEQIADIAMSCVLNVDEEVARHSVLALQSLIHVYVQEKEAFNEDWHSIEDESLTSSPRRLAEEVIRRQAWVEFRALRQLRILYRHCSGRLPEISSLIAQAVRSFGTASADKGDVAVLEIVVMFLNSLVRSAVSLKDGQACSDTLYQYRLLAEKILETQPALTQRIVTYFIYYGRMILDLEIRQIFDTVCYDIRKINEKAMKLQTSNFTQPLRTPVCEQILSSFLDLHRRVDRKQHEMRWRALLKHYMNLASFYLDRGHESFARRIFDEISDTPLETVHDIQQEILAVSEPLFWEISDRIINFNFIASGQRRRLVELAGWFESA